MSLKVSGSPQPVQQTPRPEVSTVPTPATGAPTAAGPAPTWTPRSGTPVVSAGPAPASVEARLQALNEALTKAQTSGTLGTRVANLLTGGALGSAAAARDQAVANVNQLHQRLLAKDGGTLSAKSAAVLASAIDGAMEAVSNIAEIRQGVVRTTADLGTNAALVAAAPLTGGASLAGVATLGAIGAGTKVTLNGAMEGANYSVGQAGRDALSGGAAGAAQGVGNLVQVSRAGAAVGSAVAQHAGVTAGRVVAGATNGAINAGVGGAVSGGAERATQADTWRQGVAQGLKDVALTAAERGAQAAVVGAAMGGALNVTGRVTEVDAARPRPPAAAPPKPAPAPAPTTAAPARPAPAPAPTSAAPAPAPAPLPLATRMENARTTMAATRRSVDETISLRDTLKDLQLKANPSADELKLIRDIKTWLQPDSVSILGTSVKPPPAFTQTATPQMDAAARKLEQVGAAWRNAGGQASGPEYQAFRGALDELRGAQRAHLKGQNLFQVLFRREEELEAALKAATGPERLKLNDDLMSIRNDIGELLRTQETWVYGGDAAHLVPQGVTSHAPRPPPAAPAAPAPPSPVIASARATLDSTSPSVDDAIALRSTLQQLQQKANPTAEELTLIRDIRSWLQPDSVSILGTSLKPPANFTLTATPQMDAAARKLNQLSDEWHRAGAPQSGPAFQAVMGARDELQQAQRAQLKEQNLFQVLFRREQELEDAVRTLPPSAERTAANDSLRSIRSDIGELLRTQEMRLYGPDVMSPPKAAVAGVSMATTALAPKAQRVSADQLATMVRTNGVSFVADGKAAAQALAKAPPHQDVRLVPVEIDAAELGASAKLEGVLAKVVQQMKDAGCDVPTKPGESLWQFLHRKPGQENQLWTKDNFRAMPVLVIKNAQTLHQADGAAVNGLLDAAHDRIPGFFGGLPEALQRESHLGMGSGRVLFEVGEQPFKAPASFSGLPAAHLASVARLGS